MSVINFPTGKERLMREIRSQFDVVLKVIDEPMRSQAINDIVQYADRYLPAPTVSFGLDCEPLTENQHNCVHKAFEDMLHDMTEKAAKMLVEYAKLRVDKATCDMLHG